MCQPWRFTILASILLPYHFLKQFDKISRILLGYPRKAKAIRIDTIGLEGIRRLLAITLDRGYTEEDYSAMFEVITQGKE